MCPAPGDGILSGPLDLDAPRRAPAFPIVDADLGLVVTHGDSGFTGKITGCNETGVRVRGADGREHTFTRVAGAFLLDGQRVALRPSGRHVKRPPAERRRTASGSFAEGTRKARIAHASRLWVEGIHDAELIEKVWGDDLRAEGVVVEQLEGADDLADHVRAFAPTADARLGVLLDHLLDGTKEQRIAATVSDPHVMVRGHPFVDIWQAVKPSAVGIEAWPEVPRGTPWKEGVASALGWSGTTRELWTKILRSVNTYRDLEPTLLASVEELINFVAPPPTDD